MDGASFLLHFSIPPPSFPFSFFIGLDKLTNPIPRHIPRHLGCRACFMTFFSSFFFSFFFAVCFWNTRQGCAADICRLLPRAPDFPKGARLPHNLGRRRALCQALRPALCCLAGFTVSFTLNFVSRGALSPQRRRFATSETRTQVHPAPSVRERGKRRLPPVRVLGRGCTCYTVYYCTQY